MDISADNAEAVLSGSTFSVVFLVQKYLNSTYFYPCRVYPVNVFMRRTDKQ